MNEVHRQHAQRRDLRRTIGLEGEGATLIDTAPGPDDQICARDILDQVLGKLSSEERHLAEQRSRGATWGELASELGATDVALRKKLSRALNRVLIELGLDEDVEL